MEFDSFVLAAATDDLSVEPAARDHADAVEFRMDFATDPLSALEDYDGALPVIATNRVDWEGGDAPDDDARLEALATAAEHDAVGAVDVELGALDPGRDENDAVRDGSWVVDHARERGTSVIASVHDFETTPSRADLDGLLDRATAAGDVGKLAVTAETPDDVLDLLACTRNHAERGSAIATMAMGEAGRHSRAVCPLYGSRIGYAPVDPGNATAPGQYDLATLRSLIDRLASES
ncbi:MAG: type I 3-dehydroquinate dehydratase [Halobacteriales archaeon]